MNALRLYLLGRRLTKLGEAALHGASGTELPASVVLIIQDVFAHADTAIGDIVARTSLPQSYVSASIARLRAQGVVETAADPADGRRTLVRIPPEFARRLAERGAAPADGMIAEALGSEDPAAAAEVIATLEDLAQRLLAGKHGSAAEGLRRAEREAMKQRP